MTRLGVIPAAGNGSRWGGYYKELLPCGEGEWLLDRCARAMVNGGADAILIITRPDKVAVHSAHMADKCEVPVFYAMNTDPDSDMWGSIVKSFDYPADDYLFAMPDTYFPLDAFDVLPYSFGLGIFYTRTPERFGVIDPDTGYIVNKRPGNNKIVSYPAWGLMYWTGRVIENIWLRDCPADYTDAINKVLARVECGHWPLDYYHDFAAYTDYLQWMVSQ
jgi:hypothetical protein